MRSAAETNLYRLVVDESSFNFREMSDPEIEAALDGFNNNLQDLRSCDGHAVAVPPMWDGVECLDGCELYQFLSREHGSTVDRDTLLMTYSMLSRCPEWEPLYDVATSVAIDGAEPAMALSVAYALSNAHAQRGTACIVFWGVAPSGFRKVTDGIGSADIFFFTSLDALPEFWRHLFAFEDVPEDHFFTLAALAFPRLILHEDLTFGRFDGGYRDLRDRVVTILAALCDHFADEYQRRHGLPNEVQSAMGKHKVELSPESPNTRRSDKLMRQREKQYGDHHFTCEWHAKLERHRNRIHFAAPAEVIGGKILIGIFVDHLDT